MSWLGNKGLVDLNNSSNVPLGIGGIFTGAATLIKDASSIAVAVHSDAASATDGLAVQQSADGTNWYWDDVFTIQAGAAKVFTIPPHLEYLRVVYTNGAVAQTDFELSVILKGKAMTPSAHRIQDQITDEDDAQLVKSVITGLDEDGHFNNVRTTHDGYLLISDYSSGLAIARGDITGSFNVNKFGNAHDFDTGDLEVDVWDGADDGGINKMVYTYSTTADIDSASSSSIADTQDIEIQGLDANYALTIQTITLQGQTRVPLPTPLIRIFRIKNVGSTDFAGNVYVYVNTTISGGVPTTTGPVRAVVEVGSNQTEMALFTVPAGYTAYMAAMYASTAGASKTTSYLIKMYIRPFGGVFQLKHRRAITDNKDLERRFWFPEKASEKSDIRMTAQITALGVTGGNVSAGFDLVMEAN
jgi:hypothetical protein